MNPSEMLRKLADIIDSMGMSTDQTVTQPQASLTPVNGLKQVDVDNTDQTNDKVMIPPLQQKIELLKKATGVDNAFDDNAEKEGESSDCGCSTNEEDELSTLKKNAGLSNATVMQVASEDNDITG